MTFRYPPFGHRAVALLALCTAFLAAACGSDSPTGGGTEPPPTQNTLVLNGATVNLTLATTCAARTQGLMGVTNLDGDSGMLFVFADDRQSRPFWMKDTPIALSLAYFDANKKVVFLADMPANSTTLYGGLNAPPMRYALEVRQGWFASHGVTLGMTAAFTLPATLTIEPDCP